MITAAAASLRHAEVQIASQDVDGKRIGRIQVEVKTPPGKGFPPGMLVHTDLSVEDVALGARGEPEAWNMSVAVQGRLFWRMIIGRVSLKNLSGPLSIAEFAGDSASAGASAFLELP